MGRERFGFPTEKGLTLTLRVGNPLGTGTLHSISYTIKSTFGIISLILTNYRTICLLDWARMPVDGQDTNASFQALSSFIQKRK